MDTVRGGRASGARLRGGVVAMSLVLAACDAGEHSMGTGASGTTGSAGTSTGGTTGSSGSTGTAGASGTSSATGSSSGTPGAGGSSGAAFGSGCGFSSPVTLGAPAADGYVDVPANHPDILYFGRVDCSTPTAPAFAWPGVSIRMQFDGTGVDMMLTDSGTASEVNYYDVIIDGGMPTDLTMMPGAQTYQLARNLAAGTHTVEVFKRIESAPGGQRRAQTDDQADTGHGHALAQDKGENVATSGA